MGTFRDDYEAGDEITPELLSAEGAALNALEADNADDVELDQLYAASRLPLSDAFTSGGFTTIPRWAVHVSQGPLIPRALHLSHFIAPRSETCTQIRISLGQNGAQGGTATLVRLGVWAVRAGIDSGNPLNRYYVPLATTANDPTLLRDAWSSKTKSLSVAVNFVKGNEYAWGILVVQAGGETDWVNGLPGILYEDSIEPRINGAIHEQTDLPSGPQKLEPWQSVHVGLLYARFL